MISHRQRILKSVFIFQELFNEMTKLIYFFISILCYKIYKYQINPRTIIHCFRQPCAIDPATYAYHRVERFHGTA